MVAFKVIIIGGGPVGLATAHCLRLADIDYVLFEQRDTIADKQGAGINIMPQIVRVLHQFGLLDQVREVGVPMSGAVHVLGDDRGWRDNRAKIMAEKFGYDVMLFERFQLVKLMLEALPDHQHNVRTSKSLKSIKEDRDGVTVTFEDGATEHGSIVIGADGVHSKVRQLLSEAGSGKIEAAPFTSFFRGLYGHGRRTPSYRVGELIEKHHDGWSFQTFTDRDRTYYFIYEKLKEPTKERRRFTNAEAQEFAERYRHEKVLGDATFGELWDNRDVGNLRHLEQGVSRTWSQGRVVLVGDSAHKVTPNLGVGGNLGVESAVCLANGLHALLQQSLNPDTASLQQLFTAYEQKRISAVKYWYGLAYASMNFLVLDTEQHRKAFEKRIPSFGLKQFSTPDLPPKHLQVVSRSIKLDYVPLKSELGGTCPWADGSTTSESDLRSKL